MERLTVDTITAADIRTYSEDLEGSFQAEELLSALEAMVEVINAHNAHKARLRK